MYSSSLQWSFIQTKGLVNVHVVLQKMTELVILVSIVQAKKGVFRVKVILIQNQVT